MSFTVLIPARYSASRLPGKPLREVGGAPLIWRVVERAAASGAHRVAVATDDERVAEAVRSRGGEAVMTGADRASGTDRLAEAAAALGLADGDTVVNVQGDEPFMPPALIREVADALNAEPAREMATAAHPLDRWEPVLDPNAVKVVRAAGGDALYFSRAPVPWDRDRMGDVTDPMALAAAGRPQGFLLHVGIYAYRAGFLRAFAAWSPTALERREALEQLRALEHGVAIRVVETEHSPGIGVDTPDDLERANRRWSEEAGAGA
ncbi:MAG TPA: 3-deoxy-manno-octulosonate cytidylyltransferase [Gammaproteobacteria bacterium]|nr:3-deoxy-manno-octulosonate cytidylyltransferase [Gammaproteobacteria bacterium]